jgi:SAM-dependent methyltransferase
VGLANWWDETVVPRIIRLGCGAEFISEIREQVVPQAEGRVFELGCGGGLNQKFYDPARVTAFTGMDPSPKGLEYARAEAQAKGWPADIQQGVGEALPFADESFDTVVCTFTMCSVTDQARTLAELRRVLRPGGRFLYAEHGRSPDAKVARLQQRIDPVWATGMGNCHLSRPVTSAIEAAGFGAEPIHRGYSEKGPKFAGWMEWGTAVRLA